MTPLRRTKEFLDQTYLTTLAGELLAPAPAAPLSVASEVLLIVKIQTCPMHHVYKTHS